MTGRGVEIGPYTALLAEQLRQGGVKEERVREIAADVRSHVLATGEDPVQVFGQPADYAREWAAPLSRGRVIAQVALRSLGMFGVLAAAKGALATGYPWGALVPVTTGDVVYAGIWMIVFAALPWTLDLWLSRRAARAAGDTSRTPDWSIRLAAIAAVVLIAMVGLTVAGATDTDVVLGPVVPRWLLVAGGLGLTSLLFLVRDPSSRSVPRDPLHRPPSVKERMSRIARRLRPSKGR